MELPDTQKLNDALLEEPALDLAESEPKRNSKDELITKILKVCNDANLELDESDSKLRRMTKRQLTEKLAEKIELAVQNTMAEQVGVKAGSPNSVIALGALKMVHNIAAGSAEKFANIFLKPRGYEINGFQQSLKEPHVAESIDQVLAEIAAETDVLQYFNSPYTRLALCWGSALVTSVQRCPIITPPNNKKYATQLGPFPARAKAPRQHLPHWSPENGEIRSDRGSTKKIPLEV